MGPPVSGKKASLNTLPFFGAEVFLLRRKMRENSRQFFFWHFFFRGLSSPLWFWFLCLFGTSQDIHLLNLNAYVKTRTTCLSCGATTQGPARRGHHARATTHGPARRGPPAGATTQGPPRRGHHAGDTTQGTPRRSHHAGATTQGLHRRGHFYIAIPFSPTFPLLFTRPPYGRNYH